MIRPPATVTASLSQTIVIDCTAKAAPGVPARLHIGHFHNAGNHLSVEGFALMALLLFHKQQQMTPVCISATLDLVKRDSQQM